MRISVALSFVGALLLAPSASAQVFFSLFGEFSSSATGGPLVYAVTINSTFDQQVVHTGVMPGGVTLQDGFTTATVVYAPTLETFTIGDIVSVIDDNAGNSLTLVGTGSGNQQSGGAFSASAGGAVVSGTGVFAGYTGTWNGALHGVYSSPTTSEGVIAYSINLVPEPATMAALGLGALCLIRRRRR